MIPTIHTHPIKRFAINTAGRDLAVGDVHGHFTRLQATLDAVGFNPAVDRLFMVGDLVDRGPECRDALAWLDKAHSVRGNHDDYVVRFDTCDVENWVYNGGSWFAGLNRDEQEEFRCQFNELPIAIEVETAAGLVGIIHAECPFPSWDQLRHELAFPESHKRLKQVQNTCMWARRRIELGDTDPVEGVRAVVVGHSPLDHPAVLGNVHYIDTKGWREEGYFTLIDLATLETIPPTPAKLDWNDA